MTENTIERRDIQVKRGTASQFSSINPILKTGEISFETDTLKVKIGDGATAYTGLGSFVKASVTGIVSLTSVSSSSGGPLLTLNQQDTTDGLKINATNPVFVNALISGNTTKGANTDFNLISLTSNNVGQFVVRGDGQTYISKSLGIGVTNPTQPLHVKTVNSAIQSEGEATGSGRFLASNSTGQFLAIEMYSPDHSTRPNQARMGTLTNIPLQIIQDNVSVIYIDTGKNIGFNVSAFGINATGVIGIKNGTAPSSSPSDMGQLYVEAGALKYRGSSGSITTLGVA